MAEQKRAKRCDHEALRRCATPQARAVPFAPPLEPYEICAWLCGTISKKGWRFVTALQPCCCVDRQWRLATEALLWSCFGPELRRALGGWSAWRAAQALARWWHEAATTRLPAPLAHGLVAQALGSGFAGRFGFGAALKRVRFREAPLWREDEEEAAYEAREEEYTDDDGPVVMPGHRFEGYGKITHEFSFQLVRLGQLLEIQAGMFGEVLEGNVFDHREVSVSLRPSGRLRRKTPQRLLLSAVHCDCDDLPETTASEDVPLLAAFFERQSLEEATRDLVAVVRAVVKDLPARHPYAGSWQQESAQLLQESSGAEDQDLDASSDLESS